MEFSSRVCAICGTVNQASYTRCLACKQPFSIPGAQRALTDVPTLFFPTHKLLKQRYRPIHVVGKGGMGTVYIGYDTQLGNRLVAIKEMSQHGLLPAERLEAAKNFQHEAHLLAGLQHPNLPSIYDHFEEDQRWYLVMSFVKGQALTEYLEMHGGSLSAAEALEIGIALCDVLHYLHTNHPPIIFRDLKPSNIMRTIDGHIYLIDFGIARFFKPGQARDTTNQGTSGYASPEQYGTAQTSPRSDIYSLGATLYQLLSGYEPASISPLPPLEWYAPTAPAKLIALITQMLNLDEKQRPHNMSMVKQELQSIAYPFNVLAPAPTQINMSSPPTPAPTLLKTDDPFRTPRARSSTKKRNRLIAACLILGVLCASLAATFILLNEANANTPSGVVNAFCNAMNSPAPDFQAAYTQLSQHYQQSHAFVTFQEYLRGTTACLVASPPDARNHAGLNLTIACPRGPPPNRDGTPPPVPPPPPPVVREPVNLTLIHDGGRGWKIDTIYLVGSPCAPPPSD